ncbi:DUF6677 family protein [Phycisphaerales bacterium AB-hyl4]|uniref:DUF6677 family protein n=1 Tax=Natronomicrosphaera hydrolytica TaxID=3242702 RepID=A0ABV4UAQ7_9BACT
MPDNRTDQLADRWNFTAAVAAWVFPGLGHLLLGQRDRALVLAVTIISLWIVGLLVGGVSVIDRAMHPAWFLGQMLIAPSLVVDLLTSHYSPPTYSPSFGRANEQGVLFTAMAGLLNLLAIIDVLYRDPHDPRHADANPTHDGDAREGGSA